MTTKIMTPEFRVSWPFVFTPQEQTSDDGTKRKEYSLVAIFPANADLAPLAAAVDAALVEKLGADKTKWPENLRKPFRRCREKWKMEDGKQIIPQGYEDGDACWITLKATEKFRPGIVDHNVQDIIEPRDFYAGCYARATVHPYYYKHKKGGQGVSIGLDNIQKLRDGEPIGGSGPSKPSDDFKPVGTTPAATGAASIFD